MFDVSTAYRAEMHDHNRGYLFTTIKLHLTDGRVLTYENDKIISTSRTNYVSEISAELPRKQFSFTVDNNSHEYSVDNPNGYAPYIEEGCLCEWVYKQQIKATGEYEEVGGGKTILQTWTSDDYQTTFTTVGQMDYMSGEYYKGDYSDEGRSLYDLAVDVFRDAGVSSYIIDDALRTITTKNPLPIDTHVNCLQLIANAGRAILYEDRFGNIVIEQSKPTESGGKDVTASSMAEFANLGSIHSGATLGYASGETGYTTLNGARRFAPEGLENLPVGYVSTAIADSNGNISGSPSITVSYKSATNVTRITIDSNAEFTCVGYRNGTQVSTSTDGVVGETVDEVVITFTAAAPGQRVHVAKVYVDGGSSDYQLAYRELIYPPTVTENEKVANVNVEYTEFSKALKQLRIIFDKTSLKKVVSSENENDFINTDDLFYTFDPHDVIGSWYRGYRIESIFVEGFYLVRQGDRNVANFWFYPPSDTEWGAWLIENPNNMHTNQGTGITARGYGCQGDGVRSLGIRSRTVGVYSMAFWVRINVRNSSGTKVLRYDSDLSRLVGSSDRSGMTGVDADTKSFVIGLDPGIKLEIVNKTEDTAYNQQLGYTENRQFYAAETDSALASTQAVPGENIVRFSNPAYDITLSQYTTKPIRPQIVLDKTSITMRESGDTMNLYFAVVPNDKKFYVNNNQQRYRVVFKTTAFRTDHGGGYAEVQPWVSSDNYVVVRANPLTRYDGSKTGTSTSTIMAMAVDSQTMCVLSATTITVTVTNDIAQNTYEPNPEYANSILAPVNARITESGAYYVKFIADEPCDVNVFGKEYIVNEQTYTRVLRGNGTEKTATNPLIGTKPMAIEYAKWLEDYYSSDVEYSLTYRGEPTLDCGDSILLENLFVDENIVKVNNETVDTAGGYSHASMVVARRIHAKEDGEFPYTGVSIDNGKVGRPVGANLLSKGFDLSFKKTDYITVELPENADRVDFELWVVTGSKEPMGAITPSGEPFSKDKVVWVTNTLFEPGNTHDRRKGGYASPWPSGQYMWGVYCWAMNVGTQDIVIQQGDKTLNVTVEVVRADAWPETDGWVNTEPTPKVEGLAVFYNGITTSLSVTRNGTVGGIRLLAASVADVNNMPTITIDDDTIASVWIGSNRWSSDYAYGGYPLGLYMSIRGGRVGQTFMRISHEGRTLTVKISTYS